MWNENENGSNEDDWHVCTVTVILDSYYLIYLSKSIKCTYVLKDV